MPELPEVETVKRILETQILGKVINKVEVYYERILENVNKSIFTEELINEEFVSFSRRGKFLIFILKKHTLIVHLRMEGKFFIKDSNEIVDKHEHIVIHLKDGNSLRYHDTRKFGRFSLLNTTNLDEIFNYPSLKKMGPDANLTNDYLEIYYKLHKMNCPIKQALLDQTILAGLGNIYVDEVCFLSKIHPKTNCKDISIKQVAVILENSKIVLEKAILQGGTTIRSYTSSLGVTGRFQNELLVHSRKGQECKVCKTKIKKIRVAGRGTYYCPKCQVELNKVKIVGVTGVIASGKTILTNYLISLGFPVIDCDEINREILTEGSLEYPKLLEKINEYFPSVIIDNKIDRRLLRNIIFNSKDARLNLESIIYPIIKNVVSKRIRILSKYIEVNNKPRIIFLSAPLLIESKFDVYCDEIIIVTADKDILLERIKNRDGLNDDEADTALSIRMNIEDLINTSRKREFEPFVIDNSTDLYSFQYYIDKVIYKLLED